MTAWPVAVVSGEVCADYSQVELHPGQGGHVFGLGNIGLANGEFGDSVVLTTARQFGVVGVEVQLVDAEPATDPACDAAVEFSLHTGEAVSVTGWAGDGSIAVPVPSAVDVRVRYVALGGQSARDLPAPEDGVGPDRYVIQLWPDAPASPRVVVSTSPWSQYWTFGGLASDLLVELADLPDPDRLVVVVDRALAAHPGVAERLCAGDTRYRVGVIRYLQELFRVTYSTGAYDHIRNDQERLDHLIDERARLSDG